MRHNLLRYIPIPLQECPAIFLLFFFFPFLKNLVNSYYQHFILAGKSMYKKKFSSKPTPYLKFLFRSLPSQLFLTFLLCNRIVPSLNSWIYKTERKGWEKFLSPTSQQRDVAFTLNQVFTGCEWVWIGTVCTSSGEWIPFFALLLEICSHFNSSQFPPCGICIISNFVCESVPILLSSIDIFIVTNPFLK